MAAQFATYPSLKDKVVVITGGAEGIGAATATRFAHQGSHVAILDIAETSFHKLIDTIRADATPNTVVPFLYPCDVTNLQRLQECAEQIISKFGGVDVLVNNAATGGGAARVSTFTATPEAWDFNVNVNLRHQFFLTQYLVPSMKQRGGGSIINMGSITWRIPATGLPIYTTCKAAVMGLTRTHAREFGEFNIRVNSVLPGSIATQRQIEEVLTKEYEAETLQAQAIKRVLKPDEVASVICFLGSAEASAVTGANWCVDGGWVGDA